MITVSFITFRIFKAINEWVEAATHDKIKNLVTESNFGPDTVMALVNAIYFKGDWQLEFEKSKTKKKVFYVSENKEKEV